MSNDIYDTMMQSRGREYRSDQIKAWSHYREPIDDSPGRLAGNSRVWGDASPEVQSRVIDTLIESSQRAGLTPRETAHVLAVARIESGFNPDAAAGTTSASGLGQFIDRTGNAYDLNNQNRFDVNAQSDALVAHFIDNRDLAIRRGQGEEYIYKYHHDGPTRDYGGLGLSQREVMPRLDEYERFVEQRLAQQQTQTGPQTDAPVSTVPVREREQATLSMGATGAEVTQIQHMLNATYANASLEEDGRYGALTQAQVERFQRDAGLEANGVYDPQTRTALESTNRVLSGETAGVHRAGDKGSEIADAQQVLAQLGYRGRNGAQLAADGDFGGHTDHAVRQFQQDHGLDNDGVIGPRTWETLRDAQAQHLARDGGVQVQTGAAAPGQRFNSFDEVMTAMLPAQGGTAAHITSHAGMRTLNGRPDLHEGVDFNYVGGQTGINRQHPTIHSPVSGTVIGVTSGAGSYGAIRIRDERGYEHRILHTHDQLVEAGQTVTAGVTPIGTMGGRGPNGPNQYAQHVDYRIKDPQGNWVNPERHWNEGIDVRMAAAGRLEQSDVLRTAFANIGNTDRLQTALAGTDATRAHELQKAQLQADATAREKTPDAQETRTAASIEERGHMA